MQDFLATVSIRLGLGREVCVRQGSYPFFPTAGFISFPLGHQLPSAQATSVRFTVGAAS